MASNWYKATFGTRLSTQRQSVQEFKTKDEGCRLATSIDGVLTGFGADLIIIDDPLKPDEASSDPSERRLTNGTAKRCIADSTIRKRTASS